METRFFPNVFLRIFASQIVGRVPQCDWYPAHFRVEHLEECRPWPWLWWNDVETASCLVVEPTHLKNMRKRNWVISPRIGAKMKNFWNHHHITSFKYVWKQNMWPWPFSFSHFNWTYLVQCCKKFWENTLHKVLIPVHIDIVFFSMAFSICRRFSSSWSDWNRQGSVIHWYRQGLTSMATCASCAMEMDCWRFGNSFGEKPHGLKFYLRFLRGYEFHNKLELTMSWCVAPNVHLVQHWFQLSNIISLNRRVW